MIPQGTSPINTQYFTKLQDQVSGCTVCADLQAQVNQAMASLQAGKNAITAQLALLAPILALLTGPSANLSSIVTWIQDFITGFLTPYVVPHTTYAIELADLTAQVTSLVTAINNAAARIPSCSITVPPLT